MRSPRYAPYNSPLWPLLGRLLMWPLLGLLWVVAWVWARVGMDED